MYRRSSQSRMRSGTWRGVSKWPDVKIDILDDYIRTSERFRVIRVFSEVPGSYGNTWKKQWALMGLSGKDQEVARAPPKPSPNWTRGLGRGPSLPSFPSSPLSPLDLVRLGKVESYSRWE